MWYLLSVVQRPLGSKASVVMGLELEHKQKSENLSLHLASVILNMCRWEAQRGLRMTREQALTGARSQRSLFITWVQTIQSLNQLAAGGGLGSVPGYGRRPWCLLQQKNPTGCSPYVVNLRACSVAQFCLTLCDRVDCRLPGSSPPRD